MESNAFCRAIKLKDFVVVVQKQYVNLNRSVNDDVFHELSNLKSDS